MQAMIIDTIITNGIARAITITAVSSECVTGYGTGCGFGVEVGVIAAEVVLYAGGLFIGVVVNVSCVTAFASSTRMLSYGCVTTTRNQRKYLSDSPHFGNRIGRCNHDIV